MSDSIGNGSQRWWRVMVTFGAKMRELMAERGISLRRLARTTHYDKGYLSKVSNDLRRPSAEAAEALDNALGANGELVARMPTRKAAGMTVPVWSNDRSQVTEGDVEAVREFTATFRELDNRFGGGHAHTLAAQYLESNVTTLIREGRYTEKIGKDLFGAASQLAHLAAWTAYDMENHDAAGRFFARALELSTGDPAFGGEILAAKGHHAIHLGDPVQAVQLARASQHAAKVSAMPALLAEALALEANGLAVLGESKPCAMTLHEAEHAFNEAAAAALPGWLHFLDEGYLAARFAHTLRDLGDWEQARHYAVQAISMSPSMNRTRAFNMAVLATTYVETDLEHACDTGIEALELATRLRSSRAVRYIGDLQDRLNQRHSDEPWVSGFNERCIEMKGAD